MGRSIHIKARECCIREKDRLVQELRDCDEAGFSPEERHQCYRWAARKSGRRAKACLVSS